MIKNKTLDFWAYYFGISQKEIEKGARYGFAGMFLSKTVEEHIEIVFEWNNLSIEQKEIIISIFRLKKGYVSDISDGIKTIFTFLAPLPEIRAFRESKFSQMNPSFVPKIGYQYKVITRDVTRRKQLEEFFTADSNDPMVIGEDWELMKLLDMSKEVYEY